MTRAGDRAIVGVAHIGIYVPCLAAAIELFVERLGFELTHREVTSSGLEVAIVTLGPWDLELVERPGEPSGIDHLALDVADVGGAATVLAAVGVRHEGSPMAGIRDTVALWLEGEDTCGVRLHIAQPRSTGYEHPAPELEERCT